MDVLRTSVSVLSHYDPEVNAPPRDHAANVRKAERLLAQIPTAIAYRQRIARGLPVVPPRADLDHSANFLNMVNGRVPSDTMSRAFDVSLVLYAEHELNASTFSARVTVSTLSDLYSGIVAAVGTLERARSTAGRTRRRGRSWNRSARPRTPSAGFEDALERGERIMGFGHRVYKTGDPRAAILKDYCTRVAAEIGDDRWERIAEPIERAVTAQKKLPAERRLAERPALSLPGPRRRHLHPDLRDGPGRRLGGPHHRATRQQPPDAAPGPLHRPPEPRRQADRRRSTCGERGPSNDERTPDAGAGGPVRAVVGDGGRLVVGLRLLVLGSAGPRLRRRAWACSASWRGARSRLRAAVSIGLGAADDRGEVVIAEEREQPLDRHRPDAVEPGLADRLGLLLEELGVLAGGDALLGVVDLVEQGSRSSMTYQASLAGQLARLRPARGAGGRSRRSRRRPRSSA